MNSCPIRSNRDYAAHLYQQPSHVYLQELSVGPDSCTLLKACSISRSRFNREDLLSQWLVRATAAENVV